MMTHDAFLAYLAALPPDRQNALKVLRELILQVAPEAEETMRYRMPTYEIGGRMFCAMASQKHYLSLYADPETVARHAGALAHLSLGKSCIRFKRLEDLPMETIRAALEESLTRP